VTHDEVLDPCIMYAFVSSVSLSFSLFLSLSLFLCLLAVPGFLDISPHGMRFVIRYSSLPSPRFFFLPFLSFSFPSLFVSGT